MAVPQLPAQDPGGSIRSQAERFVSRHYGPLVRFFRWMVRDPEVSADLTQETFAAFWTSLHRSDKAPPADPDSWLYAIARNQVRKFRRDHRDTHPLEDAEALPDPRPLPEAALLLRLDAETIRQAVADLPDPLAEALALRSVVEMDYRTMARTLGIREDLARWRVSRARRLLATRLREFEDE